MQTIDTQIDSQKARLAEIETALGRHPELDRARVEERDASARLEAVRRDLQRAEQDSQKQQEHIQEADKALYGGAVRNPKELQDLQAEGASLRRFLATLEERQLQAMAAAETAEKELAAASAEVARLTEVHAAASAKWRAEADTLQANITRLELQREAALNEIKPDDLQVYAGLRKTKRGLAVVRLDGGSCAACGVAPSTSRIDSAQSGQEIVQCGNCGRILYLG